MKKKYPLIDHNQSYWQLACIQISSFGLSGLFIGGQLAKTYGAGTILVSICIGNLILWIVGLSIISMAARDRNNAIENVKNYLGNNGSRVATLILISTFMAWYLLQLKVGTETLHTLSSDYPKWAKYINLRFGVFLGMLIALLSMGGIRLIKWICISAFPLILAFLIYSWITSAHSITFHGTWGISFVPIVVIIAGNLAATINLPTFFRHSRSQADSFLALILMTLFFSFFQIIGIYLDISNPSDFLNKNNLYINKHIFFALSSIFIITSTICVNLINIYFSSVGWELIFPHQWNPKEYAIVGLFGTAGYAFLQAFSAIQLFENISANFIASMGIILLLAFLVKIVAKHRPRPQEKIVCDLCWFVGCVTALLVQLHHRDDHTWALLAGVNATIIAFLFILFIEESVWSINKIRGR